MRVVGVDLAWCEENRSGLCAVDGRRVIASTAAFTDDDVVEWIEAHAEGEVLVAIDAPLIVRNLYGSRRCDRVITSAYGRAHAGCHVANRGRPWFSDGGRAYRLARRLRLRTDPGAMAAPPLRIALEVYPHTALVSLFCLPRILKYKAGRCRRNGELRSRSIDERRVEFRRLLNCLLSLRHRTPALDVTTSPEWARLVAAVEGAKTGAALDAVEDELDAYVCAYVGLHHRRWRRTGASAVVGDARGGYIVTPVEPGRLGALRRAAARRRVAIA